MQGPWTQTSWNALKDENPDIVQPALLLNDLSFWVFHEQ